MRSNITREDFDAGPPNMDCVETGLWIGNLSAALDIRLLGKCITHILTVDSCPLPNVFSSAMQIKFIQLSDLPYEDLLSNFDETFEFISDGQKNGAVLVHCYFGVSRSAAVIMAFLMKKYLLSYEDALQRLKEKRRMVGPNRGFENQLRLYETLNYTFSENNLQYRMFKLRIAANKVSKGIERLKAKALLELHKAESGICIGRKSTEYPASLVQKYYRRIDSSLNITAKVLFCTVLVKIVPQDCLSVIKPDPSLMSVRPDPRVYRCKKCRRILVLANNLLPHVRNEKPSWKDSKWSEGYDSSNICSDMYFIEPMSWISSITQTESGKIFCPRCNFKLGSFSWTEGSQCSCGAKVSPSFYLIPSRVDYSNIVQNVQVTV